MASDLTVLKSSLSDRANALGSYLGELKADLGRSDASFGHALDVCGAYTRGFVKQLDHDWREAVNRNEYRLTLESSLDSFLKRERWIDQRFARSSQGDVPRALKTIARQQFREHTLYGSEPVLTVGPPDSFETQLASLAEFLFEDFHIVLDGADQELRERGPNLSIFSAPYIEGTRVLWYPIVLGHEIAHIRLERGPGLAAHREIVAAWLSRQDLGYSALIDTMLRDALDPSQIRRDLNQQLLDWTTELICDLNAVRLFGPAGLSAIAEFLSILESQSKVGLLDTNTHPPLPIRLKVLLEFLRQIGWEDAVLPSFAKVWEAQIDDLNRPPLDQRVQGVADLITRTEHVQELIDFVQTWGSSYGPGENVEAIRSVCAELLDGVPGTTHVRRPGANWPAVSVFDVVNATWAARQALDDKESGAETSEEHGVLIDSDDLLPQTKRLRLDSLASKAIDTLELSRLWDGPRGIIAPGEIEPRQPLHRESAETAPEAIAGSVLSRRDLARLLCAESGSAGQGRMVVTPLFFDSIQDSAVDLRLGPDFIVFRHSATTAFDPLAEANHDPRTMQERVHKSWGERFILHPGELVLASTLEYIVLPAHVAAQVLTRSSYGRLGLLTATAVQVQPGSRGCITLELVNQGETPIALSPGARVAQLMLWFLSDPCLVERGKYWFPVGPEFSKVASDPDADSLRRLARSAGEATTALPEPLLRLRFDPPGPMAEHFYGLVRDAEVQEVREVRDPGARRLGAEEIGTLAAAFILSIQTLSNIVYRWTRGSNPGLILEMQEGKVVSRVDPNLPRNTVVISDGEGMTIQTLKMPPDTADDLAQALRFLQR